MPDCSGKSATAFCRGAWWGTPCFPQRSRQLPGASQGRSLSSACPTRCSDPSLVFSWTGFLGGVRQEKTETRSYGWVRQRFGSTSAQQLADPVGSAKRDYDGTKRNLTGVFQHWDCIDPAFNPGGIWRGVRIESTGPVRIDALRVLCRDANEGRANLRLHARLDCDIERPVKVSTFVDGVLTDEQQRTVAAGSNDIEWDVDVRRPALWWPWSLGDQNLTDVRVEVSCDGVTSHSADRRTGLREVAVRVGITERAVQRIVRDLEDAGVLTRERQGRRNTYHLQPSTPLRHPLEAHHTVGELLDLLR